MKLKKEFICYDTKNESFLVPTGSADFLGLVKGNKTLGVILKLLQEDTTEEQLADAVCEKYRAPKELVSKDVKKALTELRKIGALDE